MNTIANPSFCEDSRSLICSSPVMSLTLFSGVKLFFVYESFNCSSNFMKYCLELSFIFHFKAILWFASNLFLSFYFRISILAPAISQQLRQLMKVLIYELNDVIQSRLRTLAKVSISSVKSRICVKCLWNNFVLFVIFQVRSDIIQFDNTRRAFFISNHKSQSRLSLLGDDDQVRLIASHNQLTDADTFEQVLKMTQENDTVVALYYMDSEEMVGLSNCIKE